MPESSVTIIGIRTRQQGRLKQYFNRAVLGPRLLVIDEIGYLPFGRCVFR